MREAKVYQVRDGILRLAAHADPESDELVMGMAEVLGVLAARLDDQGGFSCSLDDRLDAFTRGVKDAYARARNRPRVALVN